MNPTYRIRAAAMRTLTCISLLVGLLAVALPASAEQKQRLGDWDVHYVLIQSSFLKPEIAARYGIVRGRDRALLNISVLGDDGLPVAVNIGGTVRNLLEQTTALDFRRVEEGTAIYYLAEVRHTDRETLRFAIDIVPPDGSQQRLQFMQQMFQDPR